MLVYIKARNGHAEFMMSLNMRAIHYFFGEGPDLALNEA
jgi:hypothetical protein